MKFGFYADNEIPKAKNPGYTVNTHGYRCPEFSPLPSGGKNIVILGCSHTFGEGLDIEDVWASKLEKLFNKKNLRFWNLGQPGASPDKVVRILYGCEKVLFPKIIIVCWPAMSRRERLDTHPISITGDDPLLKTENKFTDKNNLLKCVFQVEKFAEYNQAKVFHCFAEEVYDLPYVQLMNNVSLKTCWPKWDKHGSRQILSKPSIAKDGLHYGIEHHENFAREFYNKFNLKLR